MIVETIEQWLASRPEPVQECAKRYPPGWRVYFGADETPYWIIGYNEYADGTVGLKVTPINPKLDYDAALDAEIEICPQHLLENHDGEEDREVPRRQEQGDPRR